MTTLTVIKLLRQRASIREFTNTPVPDHDLSLTCFRLLASAAMNPACRVLGAKPGCIVCAARVQATVPPTSVSTNAATMIATRA